MRGYFAVKLTNLKADGLFEDYWELYQSVARRLDVVPGFTLHAPHRVTDPNAATPDGLSPRDVYLVDRMHVAHSDIMVACLELASLGVGAELQVATEFGIPVVAFYYAQAFTTPSRLIVGMPSLQISAGAPDSQLLRYPPTSAGIDALLDDIVGAVVGIMTNRPRPRPRPPSIAATLNHRRIERGLSVSELAALSGVPVGTVELIAMAGEGFSSWLQRAEVRRATTLPEDEIDPDRILLPSIWVIQRLAAALDLDASFAVSGS
jgi:hypothetical protein